MIRTITAALVRELGECILFLLFRCEWRKRRKEDGSKSMPLLCDIFDMHDLKAYFSLHDTNNSTKFALWCQAIPFSKLLVPCRIGGLGGGHYLYVCCAFFVRGLVVAWGIRH